MSVPTGSIESISTIPAEVTINNYKYNNFFEITGPVVTRFALNQVRTDGNEI